MARMENYIWLDLSVIIFSPINKSFSFSRASELGVRMVSSRVLGINSARWSSVRSPGEGSRCVRWRRRRLRIRQAWAVLGRVGPEGGCTAGRTGEDQRFIYIFLLRTLNHLMIF